MSVNIRATSVYHLYQVDCPGHPGPGQPRHGQGQEQPHHGARHRAHCPPLANCQLDDLMLPQLKLGMNWTKFV